MGLRERIKTLTTGEGTEFKRKFAEQTHTITLFAEQAVWYKEKLERLTRENEG